MRARIGWRAFVVGVVLGSPASALADTKAVEGHVVAVQDGDVIVDLAGADGAADGDVIELWRPLVLRHPVTQKPVRDRFRIGALRLWQVRDQLAIARKSGELERPPVAGDVVLLHVEVADARPAKPERGGEVAPPTPPVCPPLEAKRCSEESAVSEMFAKLRGATVRARIERYEEWARAEPDGEYALTLLEEARLLRELYGLQKERAGETKRRLSHADPASEALAGQPLTIGIELDGEASGALLHTRTRGEVSYGSVAMQPLGEGYYSVTLSGDAMKEGELEYFIEATTPSGTAYALIGTALEPRELVVRVQPEPTAPQPPEATVAVWTDYADYNRLRGNDVTWQTEGYFSMRLHDTGFRALRTGFGVFRGIGGSLEELDEQQLSARSVGLTYGYLEAEVAFVSAFALIVRGVVGLNGDGVTGGGQTMFRIGNDLETNLQIGGELLGGVGLRGIAQVDLNMFSVLPMMVRTEVTNQPAGASSDVDTVRPLDGALPGQTSLAANDIGGRVVAQVGWRIVEPLVVSVRGSYQGRTIKHSGPGLGGAVSFTW